VFFGYFREQGSGLASGLASGYYTMRIAQSVAGQWLARFVNAKGNTVKEVRATVGHGEPPPQRIKLTIDIGGGCVSIDVHFDSITIGVWYCGEIGKEVVE
jgi:hypothetical protein